MINEDEILVKGLKEITKTEFIEHYEYEGKKKEKQKPKIKDGIRVYPRDKKVAINALAYADFLC